MASTDFKMGAIAKVDREHRTHKTKDGQYIVVVKTSENDRKADLEVFDDEEGRCQEGGGRRARHRRGHRRATVT